MALRTLGSHEVHQRAWRSGWQRSRCGRTTSWGWKAGVSKPKALSGLWFQSQSGPICTRRRKVNTKLLAFVAAFVTVIAGILILGAPLSAHHGDAAYMSTPTVLKDALVT